MSKFKIGDYVMFDESQVCRYTITNKDMYKGEVVSLNCVPYDDIKIRISEHKDEDVIGEVYTVNPKYFKLWENEKMNKTEIEERINKLKAEQQNLEKQLEDLEKGYPVNGQTYYYIDYLGTIVREIFENDSFDINLFNVGNCFKTKKEAGFELSKRKLLAEIERFRQAEEGNKKLVFENGSKKYTIAYDWKSERLTIDWNSTFQNMATLYFIKSETTQKIIDKFGDRIIKMLRGEL